MICPKGAADRQRSIGPLFFLQLNPDFGPPDASANSPRAPRVPLWTVLQHAKRSRHRLRPSRSSSAGLARFEIRRVDENIVRLRVEPHRLGAHFGLYRFDRAELIRRVFMKNVKHSLAR